MRENIVKDLCHWVASLAVCLICFDALPLSAQEINVIGVVTTKSAKIMDGPRVMAEVPQGTRLWIFNKERIWLEIKIPGVEQHGWIHRSNLKILESTPEQLKRENEIIAILQKAFEHKAAERYPEARAAMQRGLDIVRPLYGEEPDVGRVLHEVGELDFILGDYTAAQQHFAEALKIRRKFLGDFNDQTGATLNSLGVLAAAQNDYPAARKFHEQALAALRFTLGHDHPKTAAALNQLGLLSLKQADFPAAEKLFGEVYALVRKQEKTPGSDTALALNNLGQVALQQGRSPEARQRYDEALQILQRTNAGESSLASTIHNNLGQWHAERGDFAAAKQAYDRAITLQRKILGENNPEFSQTLINVAETLRKQSDYTSAKKLIDEALDLVLRTVGENDARTAAVYNALGGLAYDLGDYATARANYEKNLAIRRKLKGDSPQRIVTALHNLGETARSQGDYPTARKFFEESLAFAQQTRSVNDAQRGLTLNNLGLMAYEQGDLPAAQRHYAESLALLRKVGGGQHPDLPGTLINLGELSLAQNEPDTARRHLDEALAIARAIHQQDHPQIANVLLSQANLAYGQGEFDLSETLYQQATAIFRQTLGNDHPSTAMGLMNLGGMSFKRKDYSGAWQQFDEALTIRRRLYGQDHPFVCGSLELLASLAACEGEFDAAQKHWDEARRITRRYTQYLLPTLSPREQLQYLEQRYLLGLFNSLSFGYARRADPTIANLSASWLINGKAIAQESLAARELLARDLSDPQTAPLVLELQAVRQKLATLSLAAVKREQQAAHQIELTAATAAEYRLAQDLAQRTGTTPESRDWIELGRFRRTLSADTVYIDLVHTVVRDFDKGEWSAPRYLAWVVPPHGQGTVQILDLGESERIDAAVAAARQELNGVMAAESTLAREGEAAAQALAAEKLRAVADLVLRPLLPHLGQAKQLVLSPDGALWLLPWAALPVDDQQLLVERFALQYVLSGRDVLPRAVKNQLPAAAPAMFFNPDYDLAADASKRAVARLLPGVVPDQQKGTSAVTRSSLPRAARLPNTALEGQVTEPLLKQIAAVAPQTFQGESALELVAKQLKRPSHVLLATHGFFLSSQDSTPRAETLPAAIGEQNSALAKSTGQPLENPLLRCGLLFAGCNAPRTPGLDDGILTGLEIVGMDLRGTELVVLSACETGIGKVRNGEGVAGLRQAFQLAGAQSVVSTLWQVPDRDSAIIMQDFFTNLAAGQTKADALRNAQLKRIAARKEKTGAAHPFFWAAWTVTGE